MNSVGTDRVLSDGLKENPLSPEAMDRIRRATEAEWRAKYVPRARRRWPYAAAASLFAAIALGAIAYLRIPSDGGAGELAAHLIRFEAPGVVETRAWRRAEALTEGAVLRAGHRYRAAGPALLELEGGGNLRLAAGSTIEIVAKADFRLEQGEFYVDIPPGSRSNASFVARTPAGEFRHEGTQFALAVSHGETRLRVREGSVHSTVADGESTVEAGKEVVFTNGLRTAERAIDPSGKDWDWTTETTPDFNIDNRPLGEFLNWVARECGRKLVLADNQSRTMVATIRMHGSVQGLTPLQALSAVMAATELRYDLPDGQLLVSFAGEDEPRK